MTTLNDVKKLYDLVTFTFELHGCTSAFKQEYSKRLKKLGQAIVSDLGVSKEEALALPLETELGQQSEKLFLELKNWLAGQHATFEKG